MSPVDQREVASAFEEAATRCQLPEWARNSGEWPLAAGLVLSVLLMGVVVGAIARMSRWIAWVGPAIVLFVSLRMIWDGSCEVVVAI